MAVRSNYELYTANKTPVIATKANLDLATPEVGNPALLGGALGGMVISDRVKGGVADDKVVMDVGPSTYLCEVTAAAAIDEGQAIYYIVGAASAPFLTDASAGNVLVGHAVLAHDEAVFPTGTGTVEIGVLFNAK